MKEITLYRENNGQYSTSEAKQDDVSGVYVQKEHLTDLQSQNNELRAHANRLANALVICNAQHEGSYIGGGLVREVLDETPAQTLADIRAEAVIKAANAVVRHNECGFCLHCLLIDHANKIKGCEL